MATPSTQSLSIRTGPSSSPALPVQEALKKTPQAEHNLTHLHVAVDEYWKDLEDELLLVTSQDERRRMWDIVIEEIETELLKAREEGNETVAGVYEQWAVLLRGERELEEMKGRYWALL